MNFRFSPSARLAEESHTNPNSHSEPTGEESHTNLKVIAAHVIQRAKPEESHASFVRDISLSLNMTK